MSCTRASIYRQPRAELRAVTELVGGEGEPMAPSKIEKFVYIPFETSHRTANDLCLAPPSAWQFVFGPPCH